MSAKDVAVAHEHRLANDRYHLTISDDGTGSSHFGALAITRRVPDRTRETDAFVLYVRDLEPGDFWSAGAEPVRRDGDTYESAAGAVLSWTTGPVLGPSFALRTEVSLAPGASTEAIALLGAANTRDEATSI